MGPGAALGLERSGGRHLCSLQLEAPRPRLTLQDEMAGPGHAAVMPCFQSGHCTGEPDTSHLGRTVRASQETLQHSQTVPAAGTKNRGSPRRQPRRHRRSATQRPTQCWRCSCHALPSPQPPFGPSREAGSSRQWDRRQRDLENAACPTRGRRPGLRQRERGPGPELRIGCEIKAPIKDWTWP